MTLIDLLSNRFTNKGKATRVAKAFLEANPNHTEENLIGLLTDVITETEKATKLSIQEKVKLQLLKIRV